MADLQNIIDRAQHIARLREQARSKKEQLQHRKSQLESELVVRLNALEESAFGFFDASCQVRSGVISLMIDSLCVASWVANDDAEGVFLDNMHGGKFTVEEAYQKALNELDDFISSAERSIG